MTGRIDKPQPQDAIEVRKLRLAVGSIKNLRKYHVDVLGNRYPAPQEELQMKIEL